MSKSKRLLLKIMVDRQTNKLVFAECNKDFIDVLFNILTLTLGNIKELLGKKGPIGCLNSLHEGTKNLVTEVSENMLLPERSPSELYGVHETFFVTDDLNVTTADISNFIAIVEKLGIENPATLKKMEVEVANELLSLLERSLVSKTPVSDVFLRSKFFKFFSFLWSKFVGANGDEKLMQTSSETCTKEYLNTRFALNKDLDELPLGSIVKILGRSSSSVECFKNLLWTMEELGRGAKISVNKARKLATKVDESLQPLMVPITSVEKRMVV